MTVEEKVVEELGGYTWEKGDHYFLDTIKQGIDKNVKCVRTEKEILSEVMNTLTLLQRYDYKDTVVDQTAWYLKGLVGYCHSNYITPSEYMLSEYKKTDCRLSEIWFEFSMLHAHEFLTNVNCESFVSIIDNEYTSDSEVDNNTNSEDKLVELMQSSLLSQK